MGRYAESTATEAAAYWYFCAAIILGVAVT